LNILHIDKFLDPSAIETHGGTCTVVRTVSALQQNAGHKVFEFYPRIDGESADLPAFVDYSQGRWWDTWRMIHNSRCASKLTNMLRHVKLDVAHLHSIYHHLTPSILPVLSQAGVAIVMTLHDYRMACPTQSFYRQGTYCTRCHPNRFYHAASPSCASWRGIALAVESYVQRLARRYFRYVDFFICPSVYLAQVLGQTGAPTSKIVHIPNPVRRMRVDSIQSTEPMLLFAGRLVPQKDPLILLDLAQQMPHLKIVIAGSGPMLDDLKLKASQLGLTNVMLPGQVDTTTLARCLGQCHALILPSTCYENSPLSMLEAMSAGRCVIAADQPSLRQWIKDGATGRLFEAGNVRSLKRVVTEVLRDVNARDAMADAARGLVRQCHNDKAVLDQVMKVYSLAINRRRWRE